MCNEGWGGIDCNTRIEPCGRLGWGVPNVLDKMSGWVADGYEVYAENLNCTWIIRPGAPPCSHYCFQVHL